MALSLPFSVYFLSFLNYFTLSSMYVLLNFPIPKDIYKYLSLIYTKLNEDLLAIFGIEIAVPYLGDEKVYDQRAVFFDVSSEIFSKNSVAVMFLFGNVALILFLQFLTSFLRKNNFIRKMIGENKW